MAMPPNEGTTLPGNPQTWLPIHNLLQPSAYPRTCGRLHTCLSLDGTPHSVVQEIEMWQWGWPQVGRPGYKLLGPDQPGWAPLSSFYAGCACGHQLLHELFFVLFVGPTISRFLPRSSPSSKFLLTVYAHSLAETANVVGNMETWAWNNFVPFGVLWRHGALMSKILLHKLLPKHSFHNKLCNTHKTTGNLNKGGQILLSHAVHIYLRQNGPIKNQVK